MFPIPENGRSVDYLIDDDVYDDCDHDGDDDDDADLFLSCYDELSKIRVMSMT